jgi:phosphate transport system substrate-binding protein
MANHRLALGIFGTLLFAALFLGFPCHEAQAASTLRIGGTGSGLGAMKLLAKAYQDAHPEVTVTVLPSLGSSGGIAALLKGALDLAICARALSPQEQGAGAVAVEYASSPFLFAAHRNVSQTGITQNELADFYSQESPKWQDGTRVRLILRPNNDSDTALVQRISSALDRALQKALARPGMVSALTDQDSLDNIIRMPGSLGGTTLTEIMTEQRPVRILSFNGVKPTLENLSEGSYPLNKKYYLVTTAKTKALARQFAAFLRSSRARDILAKSGNLTPKDGKER